MFDIFRQKGPFFSRGIRLKTAIKRGPSADCARRIREENKSMLSADTLAAIHSLAASCRGPIIEIGAYIGGATLALLDATKERGNTIVSIEFGVSYEHPEIPTSDSVADLRMNVLDWGLSSDRLIILEGWTLEAWLIGNVLLGLSGSRADMLVIDSDGFAERDFLYLHPLLNDGARLVFDDYMSSATAKSDKVAPFVDDMVGRGIFRPCAMLPWGTWFGNLHRRPTNADISPYLNKWRDEGWPWLDLLDRQKKEQHLPRAKELGVPLLPFQFIQTTRGPEAEAYSRVKAVGNRYS